MKKHLNQTSKIAAFIAFGALSSCMDNTLPEPTTPSTNAKNMTELVAPADFQWKTSKTITVTITGLPTVVPIKSTLTIAGKRGVLFTERHLMSESKDIAVEIPADEKILTLKFGSVELSSIIENNKASFSFIKAIN
jgi:hypothetical protein